MFGGLMSAAILDFGFATTTVTVVPREPTIQSGDVVILDLFVESDEFPSLRQYQMVLPCSATPLGGAAGSMTQVNIPPTSCTGNPGDTACMFDGFSTTCQSMQCITIDPNACGGMPANCIVTTPPIVGVCLNGGMCRAPSPDVDTSRPDYVFPGMGNIGRDAGTCPIGPQRIANALAAGQSVLLIPGDPKYLGHFMYRAEAGSFGEFAIALDGVSNPPTDQDNSRMRDPATPGMLIPFQPIFGVVTVNRIMCMMIADCDDDIFCNGDEPCVEGFCGAPIPRDCDDGVACTLDTCNEAEDRCDHAPSNAACNDGILCNGTETCDAIQGCLPGTPVQCNDGIPCTIDSCNPTNGSCFHIPSNALCSDGMFCNGPETCHVTQGCQPGVSPNCDDGNFCTDDSCNEVLDRCENVVKVCDDGDICTDDFCLPATGCSHPFNSASCDDEDDCTEEDRCVEGDCAGKPIPNCGLVSIVSSDPPNGAIDARQPSDVDGSNVAGWSIFDLTFDGDPSDVRPGDFEVAQKGGRGEPPSVMEVTPLGGNVLRITLSDRIGVVAWTTITHLDSGTSVRVGYLPADVTSDGTSGPLDVLALIDFLNGVGPLREIWSTDINRTGQANPADVLREIDLLNGAGELDAYNGVSLP